jgi:cytochrome c
VALVAALVFGALVLETPTASAPAGRSRQGREVAAANTLSTLDGVFTASQAKRGESLYYQECAMCHGVSLAGGDGSPAPPLAGRVFLETWSGKSVAELVTRVRDTMPLDSPGRLSPMAYAEITAFIFQANEFPAGARELDADVGALDRIRIEDVRNAN